MKKVFALVASEQDKPCNHKDHLYWTGRIPYTGVIRCRMCGSVWPNMELAKREVF